MERAAAKERQGRPGAARSGKFPERKARGEALTRLAQAGYRGHNATVLRNTVWQVRQANRQMARQQG